MAVGMSWSLAGAQEQFALDIKEFHLDNGLEVLILEDHAVPLVTVQAWYRVGSRNERPGITGISHFLEHMMFKGTEIWPWDVLTTDPTLRRHAERLHVL